MFCKNCGSELKDDEKFCTNCGAKVANSNNENPNTNKIIIAIIAVFILVTTAILLFIFLNNQNMKGEEAINFQQLKLTQRKWLKDVEAYYTVFEEQGFGTIGKRRYCRF